MNLSSSFVLENSFNHLPLVTMNHYLGHCQGYEGRWTIELQLQLFSPFCSIAIFDFETHQTHRLTNRQFNFQSREHPTDPEKEWATNSRISLRAIMYRLPDSAPTRDLVQRIPMNFEISWSPCWINARWREFELYNLLSIRPKKKQGWAIDKSPPPKMPQLYYDDVAAQSAPTTHQAPGNSTIHEPSSTHEPSSSSGQVTYSPAAESSVTETHTHDDDEPPTESLDSDQHTHDDNSIIRGDDHVREYSPDEFVTRFGWGVVFTVDENGAFRDELVEYSDYLVPSHQVEQLNAEYFPEENRDIPFTELTHDSPEFQVEVPIVLPAPATPPPAFRLPKSPPPPPPETAPANHLVVHRMIHSKSLPLIPAVSRPSGTEAPWSIHTRTGVVHPPLPVSPFRPPPGSSAPNPLMTDNHGHRFELTPAALALRLEPERNHPRLTNAELIGGLRNGRPKAPQIKAPPANIRPVSLPPRTPETDPDM